MFLQIYNRDGTIFQNAVKILSKDISFSNVLWSGQTSLSLDLEYSNWDLLSKFVKFYVGEKLVFSGEIIDEQFDFFKTTSITIYWLYDLYNCISPRLTLDSHGAWIEYLSKKVNERYPFANITFDINSLESYTKAYTSYTLWSSILNDVVLDSKYDFFLGADWVVRFAENISTKTHFLSIGKDAEIIWGYIWRTKRDYVSEAIGIDGSVLTEIKNEEASNTWGIVSRGITQSSGNPTLLAKEIQKLLKNPSQKTPLKVKNNWQYEVWDFVTIENSKMNLQNIKIVKIDFSLDTAILHLDSYSSIYKNIKF